MDNDDRVVTLLQEIRDAQREHLAEYRKVAQRSVELQEEAVARQQSYGNMYRRIVAVGAVMVAILLGLLVYLLIRYSHALFG